MGNLKILLPVVLILTMADKDVAATDLENTILMDLKNGQVVIEMLPEFAPKHVERIKELVRQEFYDGVVFHRVIEGFMAQGGDPTGTGTGGSGQNLDAEFSDARHVRGTLSMARSQNPNSCLLYTSPSPRDRQKSRMPSSA